MKILSPQRAKYILIVFLLLIYALNMGPIVGLNPKLVSESVNLNVPGTSLLIIGQTSPSAFVEMDDNSNLAATTQADTSGNFQINLNAPPGGINDLALWDTDSRGDTTSTVQISINIATLNQVVLRVFMPSTITTTNSAGGLVISGETYPGAQIAISVNNDLTILPTPADSNGFWEVSSANLNLSAGINSIYVLSITPNGGESYPSQTVDSTLSVSPTPLSTSTTNPGYIITHLKQIKQKEPNQFNNLSPKSPTLYKKSSLGHGSSEPKVTNNKRGGTEELNIILTSATLISILAVLCFLLSSKLWLIGSRRRSDSEEDKPKT